MPKPFARVEGDKKLIKQLKRLGSVKVAKRVLRKAVNAASQEVVKAVRRNAPVDTGTYKIAATKKVVGSDFNYTGIIGADAKAKGPVVDGATRIPANYDHLIEYGYQLADGTNVPAQAPLRKGFEQAAPAAQRRLNEKLKEGIEREAAKGK